jgi:hypothetical protein
MIGTEIWPPGWRMFKSLLEYDVCSQPNNKGIYSIGNIIRHRQLLDSSTPSG